MTRLLPALLLCAASLVPSTASGAEKAAGADPRDEVARALDDWHDAAAKADERRYFARFAPEGVFLGTDPEERWTVEAFRAWAKPYFSRGKAWSFRATQRWVTLSPDGGVAWFDERLDTPNMGPCRGAGALRRIGGTWKLVLYDLSIPIPNELTKEFVKRIAQAPAPPRAP